MIDMFIITAGASQVVTPTNLPHLVAMQTDWSSAAGYFDMALRLLGTKSALDLGSVTKRHSTTVKEYLNLRAAS